MSPVPVFVFLFTSIISKADCISTITPTIDGDGIIEIQQGAALELNCSVDGNQTLEWYYNQQLVRFDNEVVKGVTLITERNSSTISRLIKLHVQSEDSGMYTCSLEGGESPATVNVTVKPTTVPASTMHEEVPRTDISLFNNVKALHATIAKNVGGLLEVANAHEYRINDLDNFIVLQYEKLEKWLSDMQTRIKLDHIDTVEVVEGHGNKLQDLSSQLDAHESKLNLQLRQIQNLETVSLPGANLGREIETLRRDVYEIQSQQLIFNQTAQTLLEQLKSIKDIVTYIEKKIDEPEIIFCEDDSECSNTDYCSITRKGNICELKSPPGTFCLRSNKCMSGSCNWLHKCD